MKKPMILGTGLTRGIGRALARILADQVDILSLQRSDEPPVPGVRVLRWDLAAPFDEAREGALMDALAGRPVWGFLHCAGVLGPVGPARRGEAAAHARAFEEAFRINVTSAVEVLELLIGARAFAPRPPDQRPPFILHLSSGAALNPYQGWEAYCASKAALRMMFRAWAERFGASELVVASVAPGTVLTDMMKDVLSASPDAFPAVGKFHSLRDEGKLVPPEEPAARIAEILLGEERDFINLHGKFFDVRKGFVAGA
jgi:benzil reductase ((S)-benzoin forming)